MGWNSVQKGENGINEDFAMTTYTETFTCITSGLGTIVRVDTKEDQTRPDEYEYHYSLFFVPNDGVTVETYTNVREVTVKETKDYGNN